MNRFSLDFNLHINTDQRTHIETNNLCGITKS